MQLPVEGEQCRMYECKSSSTLYPLDSNAVTGGSIAETYVGSSESNTLGCTNSHFMGNRATFDPATASETMSSGIYGTSPA